MTSPASKVKGRGSRDVRPVNVGSAVQKTQHRLSRQNTNSHYTQGNISLTNNKKKRTESNNQQDSF